MKPVKSLQVRAEAVREKIVVRRPESATLDTVLRATAHNQRVAGNLLASAVAYRLFLWLLPLSLVASAGAGFLYHRDTSSLEDVGMSTYVRSVVDDAADQAHQSRWVVLIIGLVALYSTSGAAYRAMRVVHQLAWELPVLARTKTWKTTLGFMGFATMALVAGLVVQVVRSRWNEYGLAALLSTFVLYGGLWLLASLALPHRDVPVQSLLPGALLVSVGVVGLHLFTFLYLDRKLSSSSELYGAFGAAAAILLWLYLIGYLIVGSSVLNMTMWSRTHPEEAAQP